MLPPLHFEPILKPTPWGGRRLGTDLGKSLPLEGDYGESWEIADCGTTQTVIRDGPYDGWTLARLMAEHVDDLVGPSYVGRPFPLLIKFLDARGRLSVQVHPNDAQSQRMGLGVYGKSEAWVILDASPES